MPLQIEWKTPTKMVSINANTNTANRIHKTLEPVKMFCLGCVLRHLVFMNEHQQHNKIRHTHANARTHPLHAKHSTHTHTQNIHIETIVYTIAANGMARKTITQTNIVAQKPNKHCVDTFYAQAHF